MENLRIEKVVVSDSKTIVISFTHELINNLNETNVSIISDTSDVPDATPLSIIIDENEFRISCTPLAVFGIYYLVFNSTPTRPFISVNGVARLPEDGVVNKYSIIGPIPEDNPVKRFLKSYYDGNIYDIDNADGLISKYIDGLSNILSQALYDIGQVKNENYISNTIIDEVKVRGDGPTDRLDEESAYQLLRVGRTTTDANATKSINYDVFPFYPITLQGINYQETLGIETSNTTATFNKIDFILNLSKNPVVRLTSVKFIMNNATQIYNYNIETLGYQILDSRYDQEFSFTYNQITDSQIKLSDKLLEDSDFVVDDVISVMVGYQYKNLGIVPDDDSITISEIRSQVREVLPPIINIFNLEHNDIVDDNGDPITIGGITFSDPNSNDVNSVHPAFEKEIEYKLSGLPHLPGQYAVDYKTGTVYVYGEDEANDGTGPSPPLATYNYKYFYSLEQDYVYDENLVDLVSLPTGVLRSEKGTVSFSYEEALVPGVDYEAPLHQEELNERINNNLLALNVLRTQRSPITNVFRIYNETSGEIYVVDRWNKDKVYFTYNNPPRISSKERERVSFKNITNELLFVKTSYTNVNSIKIFEISLNNDEVIAASEDGLGYFRNSSVFFSDADIFVSEKWFNQELDSSVSINNIDAVGEYIIDYNSGTVYVGVSSLQDNDLGTVNYKINSIVPLNDHLISVENLYYQISPLSEITTVFNYVNFGDDSIVVNSLHSMDEQNKSAISSANYFVYNKSIGVFEGAQFYSGVTYKVKSIRGIYEFSDITNSTLPLNFANYATFTDKNITVNPVEKQNYHEVQHNISDGYFILLDENIPYISPNITYTFSVVRPSTGDELWDVGGTVESGTQLKLILSGANSPIEDETVFVDYSFTINNSSNIVVDYNRGEFYVDYTYLADEIIVSYEYGDNVIDFRESTTLSEGEEYYVSYRVGALRGALLQNFGTLIDVPELVNFDINFDRERYRDAVFAGLSSFVQGPTVEAIKTIGKVISHIEPIISESIFEGWSLGKAILSPQDISTTGDLELVSGKFDHGVIINEPDQTISFPYYSNIRLQEGTFESWVKPNWHGLDNNAELTFTVLKDGVVVDPNDIFIGMSEIHPTIDDGKFNINKLSDVGEPNLNKDGLYIYYVEDDSSLFNKWCVHLRDGYSSTTSTYSIRIDTTGYVYNFKSEDTYDDVSVFSGQKYITINISPTDLLVDRKFTFISDQEKYLLDFGSGELSKNRISIYKDVSGYFVFRVFDNKGKQHYVSYDVSGWSPNELHHVAASWKLNTKNNADEMHLFIDGMEVPNLHKYKQKFTPYLYEDFRTISDEEVLGLADKDIIASIDLNTTLGSNVVSSSLNFGSFDIDVGDTIFINEVWFDENGYTITNVSGQELTLDSVMPITLTDARFSINKTTYTVDSFVNSSANVAVSRIEVFLDGYDLSGTVGESTVSSASVNFDNEDVIAGYSLRIDDGYSPYVYPILNVSGNQIVIDGNLPITFSNTDFYIYSSTEEEIPGVRAERPSYSVGKDGYCNDTITFENNVFANDLLLIRTLGLNSEIVNTRQYLWSDWQEHIIKTQLPPPISLDCVDVKRVILQKTRINTDNGSMVGDLLVSNEIETYQPINAQEGRSLAITVSGTNIDFADPVEVDINGVSGTSTITETVQLTADGYEAFTSNLYHTINWIKVRVNPIDTTKTAAIIEIKERYNITVSENSGLVPEIKFSYHMGSGSTLYTTDGYTVSDDNNLFSHKSVGDYLLIHEPAYDGDGYSINVPGFYVITGISEDRHSLEIESTVTSSSQPLDLFTDGYYTILNTTDYRSGLQNGWFTFEASGMPSVSYPLPKGYYDFEYKTYAKIKIKPNIGFAYIGSDLTGANQIDSVIDQVKIYSTMLTDTRVGEVIPTTQRSITKDYNSLIPLTSDANTLMLLSMNSLPIENVSDQYVYTERFKEIFYSSDVVNDNFGNSICIQDKPIVLSNDGILDSTKEGTIEMWVNPKYDTGNDPNLRYYFDASSAVVEDVISDNNSTVRVSGSIGEVISVKLTHNNQSINYFDGGRVEVDTDRTIREIVVSTGDAIVKTSKNILQVSTVKIDGDPTNTDYFNSGTVGSDRKTIYLGNALPQNNISVVITYQPAENQNDKLNKQVIRLNRKLPHHNTPITVSYIPKGLRGDRLSLFKDEFGYVNFMINSKDEEYVVRAPTLWTNGTWHRIKASYIVNSGNSSDEMRLWLDGYEYSNIYFGSNISVGKYPVVLGGSQPGDGYYISGDIIFKDPVNTLFIGSAFDKTSPIFTLIDNLRVSNASRPIYKPYGESIDVNYNSNISAVLPVTEDLYTTYLLNLSSEREKTEDLAVLKNRETGLFNFLVKIIDSYGIIDSSEKSKKVLEKLINILKPANTRAFIEYVS